MIDKEKELILDLSLNTISKQVFLKEYPLKMDQLNNYVLEGLNKAYLEKDADDVGYAILLGFIFDIYSFEYVDILLKLITENWHYKHEDIASILQSLKAPQSVNALYEAALNKPRYMDYDDSYSLARKCIHALADINTENAREKLRLLAQSNIPIVKEKASKQLLRIN